MREQFLARFGNDDKTVDEYREEIGQLFKQHADPVVFEATDFSRFCEIAEQYRDRVLDCGETEAKSGRARTPAVSCLGSNWRAYVFDAPA